MQSIYIYINCTNVRLRFLHRHFMSAGKRVKKTIECRADQPQPAEGNIWRKGKINF